MKDVYHSKPYCKPGESEAHYALGYAILFSPVCLCMWFLLLWAIGVVTP